MVTLAADLLQEESRFLEETKDAKDQFNCCNFISDTNYPPWLFNKNLLLLSKE